MFWALFHVCRYSKTCSHNPLEIIFQSCQSWNYLHNLKLILKLQKSCAFIKTKRMSSSFCMLPYNYMYLFIHISRDFLKVVVRHIAVGIVPLPFIDMPSQADLARKVDSARRINFPSTNYTNAKRILLPPTSEYWSRFFFLSQKAYGLRSPFCRDKSFFVLCIFSFGWTLPWWNVGILIYF